MDAFLPIASGLSVMPDRDQTFCLHQGTGQYTKENAIL